LEERDIGGVRGVVKRKKRTVSRKERELQVSSSHRGLSLRLQSRRGGATIRRLKRLLAREERTGRPAKSEKKFTKMLEGPFGGELTLLKRDNAKVTTMKRTALQLGLDRAQDNREGKEKGGSDREANRE